MTKNSTRFGFPFSISVEPTTSCNLSCPQCPVGLKELKRPSGNIEFELFKKITDQSAKYLLNLFIYFQGEPFLNKSIFDLINYSNKKNIYTVTSTNAHFLTDENIDLLLRAGLDKLIISVDGTNQETYEKYRINGNFKKVITGVDNLMKKKLKLNINKPFVELQFLVLRNNEYQIDEMKTLAKKLKVDVLKFKSAQIYDFETDEKYIPKNKKYSRYTKINSKWAIKKKIKNRCFRLWNSVVITWDGNVLPCCFDKNAKYSFGNIKNNNIKELVNNTNFKLFANKVLTNRKKIDICSNCTE